MLETKSENQVFQSLLEDHLGQICSEDSLKKVREKAWDLFLKVGLPTKNQEVFRYVRQMRTFFSQPYLAAKDSKISPQTITDSIYLECKNSLIVFVNGHFDPKLSNLSSLPEKISISTLSEAARPYGAFLNNQWSKLLKEEKDPFAIINAAMHRNGIFIYIPPNTTIDSPIQILNVIHSDSPMLVMPRVHLFMGTQASATVVSSHYIASGQGHCMNQVIELNLDEGSRLHLTQANTHENIWHFEALRATLKRDSVLNTVNVTKGSQTTRHDYRVLLTGENAEAYLNGLWMLEGKRECHTNVVIEHQAPHCRSNQFFKGALSDHSYSSFEGKIYVHQIAQKTEAFQLNKNLILNESAMAYCKPNLEIFADDVKASHGATIGQLDEEQLFYLKTRGFSESEAKNLLVYGFCEEILDKIPLPSLNKELSLTAKNYLK